MRVLNGETGAAGFGGAGFSSGFAAGFGAAAGAGFSGAGAERSFGAPRARMYSVDPRAEWCRPSNKHHGQR